MQAIILAGGKGTRLAPYTLVFPKPMLPVGGQPIIQTIVKQLAFYGFNDIVISLGYLGDLIEIFFRRPENIPPGVTIRFVKEEIPLGTSGAISLVDDLDENFLVINGDILTTLDFSQMVQFHSDRNAALTVGVSVKEMKISLGVLDIDTESRILGMEEKPTYRFNDNMGIYIYNRKVLDYLPRNERTDFNFLLERMLKKAEPVYGFKSDGAYFWIDIGQHADFERANDEFEKHRDEFLKE
jgi:NDP-mannose synthase